MNNHPQFEKFTCFNCDMSGGMIHTGTISLEHFPEPSESKVVVISLHDEEGFFIYSRPNEHIDNYENLEARCISCGAPIPGDVFCKIAYDQHFIRG